MNNGHMLYRCPGSQEFEGVKCETTIVEAEDVEAAKAEGWHVNWIDADRAQQGQGANVADLVDDPGAVQLHAVHKGRGVYELQDAAGNVVEAGLTREQAQAKVGG